MGPHHSSCEHHGKPQWMDPIANSCEHHRKPQWMDPITAPVNTTENLSGWTPSQTPAAMAQGTSWRRGWKDCRSRNTRNSAVKVSPRNGCIDKIRTTVGSHLGEELWVLGEGELASSRDEPTYCCPVLSRQPWNHIHRSNNTVMSPFALRGFSIGRGSCTHLRV